MIYAYRRKDALADGVQIDVSEVAREAGLKFPVYLTRTIWKSYVTVPEGVRCQDEKGRIWDIVLCCAAPLVNIKAKADVRGLCSRSRLM